MNENIRILKGIAYDRIIKTRLGGLSKVEKIRLSDELRLIDRMHAENYFTETIANAD